MNNIFTDLRGYNLFIPTNLEIKQQFISNTKKDTIRGIHVSPYGKIVSLLAGRIIDYIIDFSNNTINIKKTLMTINNNNKIYVPPNCGHLWISLEDNSIVLYQLEGIYDSSIDINIHYLDPYINLDIDINKKYILSDKDNNSKFYKNIDYIIIGSTGFLGKETIKYLNEQNKNYICLNIRLEDQLLLEKYLKLYKPKYIICSAGISGKPTISWCETNEKETYNINFLSILNLAKICDDLNIHLTIYGSAIVYKDGINNEDDIPNNNNFVYTKYRILLEKSLEIYKNILYLRLQYPIAFNDNPKCFMQKTLTRLNSINNNNINITFIPELFPKITYLIENNITGILNFVNPGVINITELLDIYKKYKNNIIKYNIVNSSPTSGLLDTSKLLKYLPFVKNIKDSIIFYLENN